MIHSKDLLFINVILQLGKKRICFTVNVLDHTVALMPEILAWASVIFMDNPSPLWTHGPASQAY